MIDFACVAPQWLMTMTAELTDDTIDLGVEALLNRPEPFTPTVNDSPSSIDETGAPTGVPTPSSQPPSAPSAPIDWREKWIRSGRRIRRKPAGAPEDDQLMLTEVDVESLKDESRERMTPDFPQTSPPRCSPSNSPSSVDSARFRVGRRHAVSSTGINPIAETLRNQEICRSKGDEKIRGFAEVWEKGPRGTYEIHLKRLPGCAAVDMPYITSPVTCPEAGVFAAKTSVGFKAKGNEQHFHINPAYDDAPEEVSRPHRKMRIAGEVTSFQQQRSKIFGTPQTAVDEPVLQKAIPTSQREGEFDAKGRSIGARRRKGNGPWAIDHSLRLHELLAAAALREDSCSDCDSQQYFADEESSRPATRVAIPRIEDSMGQILTSDPAGDSPTQRLSSASSCGYTDEFDL
eukprot:Blabericola_migrator_1__12849@NODE_833_length_6346_cov_59_823061_g588_i0_p3_GENE_NODE_833_length_6346_cov_59_823061_g588_i0NODE_833_length_6346_cov_59_823061_g588_i0_p3_ORF_typecomplete_len403_score48_18_NODE_833_length_6346_cov_59_823061_g588_i037854993